ncbi:MAG: alanine racemase [Acidimicrobiales bacterium]
MSPRRQQWAEVDLAAVAHNVAALSSIVAPSAVCAVVKADAYGHGAVPVAEVALAAGASWLAVARVEEGVALRDAGIVAPVLLLSEPLPAAMAEAVSRALTPTVYTAAGVAAVAAAARAGASPVGVHLKVDTGMHRVGADPDEVPSLARAVAAAPDLWLEGLWTHLAVADDPSEDGFTAEQLARLDGVRRALAHGGIEVPILHAANSAGALAHPASRLDVVRCGIAVYGQPPSAARSGLADLRPALSLHARVSLVRRPDHDIRVSYGRRYTVAAGSQVATVPLGYADGVPRRLSEVGGEVLVGGRRRPVAGTITMDQLLVDCGPGADVAVGDEVVLLGRQGPDEVTAGEWAKSLGTISYEILCGIGSRVPRIYTGAIRDPGEVVTGSGRYTDRIGDKR